MAWMRSGVRSPSAPQSVTSCQRLKLSSSVAPMQHDACVWALVCGVLRRFAELAALTGLVGAAGTVGCNTPPLEPVERAAASSASSASSRPSGAASTGPSTRPGGVPGDAVSAATSASATCASDSDCRTFSSYCAEAPCACRALLAWDPDPKCLGAAGGGSTALGVNTRVSCFVDPCMKKAARCQAGACVLTVR